MNYSNYKMSTYELFTNLILGAGIVVIISKIFYGNYWISVPLSPMIIFFLKIRKKMLNEKRIKQFKQQFKDAITSIADAMSVGYSIENAIRESYKEMKSVYGTESYICVELLEIIRKMEVKIPLEISIGDMAKRTGIEEVMLFSQVFSVVLKTGGSMKELVLTVAEGIGMNMQVEEEINVAISDKKMEQKIMCVVPIALVLYVSISSPGFFDIMYETVMGNIIMTACLAAYIFSIFLSQRIMNIEM